ncbi:MAG: threonylcarbamoyl-AMP synthase [Bacteroidia bacterium]|nr:threonylcarbamoyl-AMP synthase [Bacteroidia bacterium]
MEFQEEIKKCLDVLKNGGLILYPTDTIWGIGCDATNSNAIKKIYRLKNRNDSKSLILLLDTENRLQSYVESVPENAWAMIDFAEKPLTIIYDNGKNLPPEILAGDGSVAIRVTRDPFCSELIRRFRKPLVSTSANISGHPAPGSYLDISDEIKQGVDYVVNLRRMENQARTASTIIRMKGNGQIEFLRK